MNRKSRLAVCLCALLLCSPSAMAQVVTADSTPAITQGVTADSTPAPKAFASAGDQTTQTVRVLLRRLGVTDRMDLVLDGQYTLRVGETELSFERGSELAILLRDGQLAVYYHGLCLQAGDELALVRHTPADGGENGFRLAYQKALYEGDLRLTAAEGVIRPILSIDVEDYLAGVIAFEMGDSFPVEALKAQAVAARTYALCRVNPKNEYDVVDTTNDQVFKGRMPNLTNVETAIAETRGLCGFYKGKLVNAVYSASNGGQTELASHVWENDDGYLAMTDDLYDLENPASTVKRARFPKQATSVEDTPYRVRELLASQLRDTLTAQGYDTDPMSLRVDEVSALSVDTPQFADPSRLMTALHITFRYSARTRTDAPTPVPVLSTPAPDDEVSLFGTQPPATDTPEPTDTPAPTPTPSPTPPPVYGEFVPSEESVTLTIPIFPDAEKALTLGINSNDNELYTVAETDDAFTLEARRFGHGVGLSQRGAEWMALRYGKTFDEILAFYYPGVTLARYETPREPLPTVAAALLETAGPAPTATPRPTLMPVTEALPQGAWYAAVTGIDEDSSLNLRAEPSTDADIVRRLYKHQRLMVLIQCPQEGWVKVRTDAAEGYVMERFLTKE